LGVLQRISYNSVVIRTARVLGLRRSLRRLYYHWARPSSGTMTVRLGGFDCGFVARTPEQVRMLGKAQTGRWRLDVLEFLDRRLKPGDVVYDVGSNIGLFSIFAARKVTEQGRVFAFEPNPETFSYLQENIRLNELENLCSFQVALGNSAGEAELFAGEDLLFSSLVAARNDQTAGKSVRVVEGDRLREEQRLPQPNVLMIDVEGYEYAAIRGLRQSLAGPACRAVVCEVHPTLLPKDVSDDGIIALLRSYGFDEVSAQRNSGMPEFYLFGWRS